jgi:hypothetical protein
LKTFIVLFTIVASMAIVAIPAGAHHGTNISYQQDKSVALNGSVTEWVYAYPHPQIYVDVKESSGSVSHWSIELAPTPRMMQNLKVGWGKASIKAGDQVALTVRPSKVAGATVGLAFGDIVVNGKKMPLANPQQAAPPAAR